MRLSVEINEEVHLNYNIISAFKNAPLKNFELSMIDCKQAALI